MNRAVATLFLFFTGLGLGAQNPWASLALSDLQAIHDALEANHPGPKDRENPAFSEQLRSGYRASRRQAARAGSFEDYAYVLASFTGAFRDTHLGVEFLLERPSVPSPGFFVRYERGAFFVSESTRPEIPNGSKILSCDERPVEEIFRDEVLATRPTDPNLPSSYEKYAPYLFHTDPGQWIRRHSTCRFDIDGSLRSLALDFRRIPRADLARTIERMLLRGERPIRIEKLSDKVRWIDLSTFFPTGENLGHMEKVVASAPSWRSDEFVVFDLRGNDGGSSFWGKNILRGLYGDRYFDSMEARSPRNTVVDWRVSKGNIDHLKLGIAAHYLGAGETELAREINALAERMKIALREKNDFIRDEGKISSPASTPPPNRASRARIIAIIDSICVSACLGFLDDLSSIPGTVLVGTMTGADSNYMEVRGIPLPSGLARLAMAVKVYRNRKRGAGVTHAPTIPFPGNIHDTNAVRTWIQDTVLPKLRRNPVPE